VGNEMLILEKKIKNSVQVAIEFLKLTVNASESFLPAIDQRESQLLAMSC